MSDINSVDQMWSNILTVFAGADDNAVLRDASAIGRIDPSLIQSIKKLVIEEKPREIVVDNHKKPRRPGKNKTCKTKSMFGNPLRNISDELTQFYKTNVTHKRVIMPVLENLGFDK